MEPKETWKDKLKQAWDDNPLAVLGVGAVAASAAAKLISAATKASEVRSTNKMRRHRRKKLGW